MDYIQYNWIYLLFGIVIYILMLSIARPDVTYKDPRRNNIRKNILLYFLLFTFFSVYGLWEWDAYHIWDHFIGEGRYVNFYIEGYEEVYNWLGNLIGPNYFLWRFFIWVPACIFIYLTARKISLLNRNFLVSLALFGGFLSYTRGMLGHTMLIYGLVLLCCSEKKQIGKIIGLLIVIVSYYFHKSMYINILFALLALVPFGRKTIILSLPLLPLAIFIASMTVSFISSGELVIEMGSGVGGVGDRTLRYIQLEKSNVTILGHLGKFIELLPIILLTYYLYERIYVKRVLANEKNGKLFLYLFRVFYVALYISMAYYFLNVSEWISSRFRYMSFFSLIFVVGKIWSLESKADKLLKSVILLQIFAILYRFANQLYDWYHL